MRAFRGLTERKSQQRGDLISDHLTGQGRDFAAWLGLVPKESTGDRTILGKISKRGNKYQLGSLGSVWGVPRTSLPRIALNVLRSSKSVLQCAAGPYIWHYTFQAHRNAHPLLPGLRRQCTCHVPDLFASYGVLLFGFQSAGCVGETNLWIAGRE